MSQSKNWESVTEYYRERMAGKRVFRINSDTPLCADLIEDAEEFKQFLCFLVDEGHLGMDTLLAAGKVQAIESSVDLFMKGDDVLPVIKLFSSDFDQLFPHTQRAVMHWVLGIDEDARREPARVFRLFPGGKA